MGIALLIGTDLIRADVENLREPGCERRAGHAQDVARHGRELDPRILEDLVEPVGLTGAVLEEGLPVPGEVPELPDRRRRDEAPPQEPALQQLGDQSAVGHVGLPPGDIRDVGGVHEEEAAGVLEHVVDGFR